MKAFDGRSVHCVGIACLDIVIHDVLVRARVIGLETLIEGVDIIVGMDVLSEVGKVTIDGSVVMLEPKSRSEKLVNVAINDKKVVDVIDDKDFKAFFDGEVWRVEWKWMSNPPKYKGRKVTKSSTLANLATNFTFVNHASKSPSPLYDLIISGVIFGVNFTVELSSFGGIFK